MRFEQFGKTEMKFLLTIDEAIELRDSPTDLIERNDINIHHHICSYNLENNTIEKELIVAIQK